MNVKKINKKIRKRALVNVKLRMNSRLACVVVLKEIRSMVKHKMFCCRLLLLLMWWLLKEPFVLWCKQITYARSPRIRRAN